MKRVLALCVLSMVLVFTGCDTEPDDEFVDDHKLNGKLIGTWISEYDDSYTITTSKLTYDDGGWGFGYTSTIEYVSNFTSTAGVIIVKYDEGDLQGKFIAVYYENFKPGVSVQMAEALNADYSSPACNTLESAKKTFTAGNKGTYVVLMGTYTK